MKQAGLSDTKSITLSDLRCAAQPVLKGNLWLCWKTRLNINELHVGSLGH